MLPFYALCVVICLVLVCTGWVFANPGEMSISEAVLGIVLSVIPVVNFGVIVAVMIVAYEEWERKREVVKKGL